MVTKARIPGWILLNVVETFSSDRAVQKGNGLFKKEGLCSMSQEDFNHTPVAHLMKKLGRDFGNQPGNWARGQGRFLSLSKIYENTS